MGRSTIWVRIQHGDQGWSGRLVPGRCDRIHVHFPHDDGPVHLPIGETTQLGIAQPGMAEAVRDEARLVRVDRRREEALECEFELVHPTQLHERVKGAVIDPHVENRRWLRAPPDPSARVIVPVTLPDAPPSAQRLVGRMIDGSAGGVGLAFTRVAEPRLAQSTTMRVQVPLPGLQGTGVWVCDVRYRRLMSPTLVRYGLQFKSDGVAVEPPGPQLEELWDCSQCSEEGLLDGTHAHCPACGAPATGPSRHPTWRELATVDVHPMCGTDVECPACAVAHSHEARYCAHCGEPLPQEETADLPTQRTTSPGR